MNKNNAYFLATLVCLTLTTPAHTQPSGTPITIGEQLTIESTVLDEQRSVIVGLPDSYQLGDEHYPVLYVLDGSDHFHYTTGLTRFLATNEFIPEMIVIAVNNTDRTRDMTPPSEESGEQQNYPNHGGAENFQRFFAEDLMPWVEENYRTHPYNVLIGHSLGGLFAVHTLISRPELFNAYIAISPSMWWDDQGLVDQAEEFFSSTAQLPVSLYMTVGNEGGPLLGGTRKLSGVLDAATPQDFLWQFDHMPLETHGTVPHRSTYQGLEFVFANWALRNPYDVYSQYGLEAVKQFHAFGDQRYGTRRGIPVTTQGSLLGNMIRDGDLASATTLLTQPAETDTTPSGFYSFLADALRASGDQEQSTHFYLLALQKNPGNMMARAALDESDVDYSTLIPQVQVAANVLQSYEGMYSSTLAGVIKVSVEDGQLYRELNSTRFKLHPLSDTEFYLQEDDVRYNFRITDSGEISGIHIRLGNIQFIAERQ
ncbi:MAG: alpha/beta hydrolase-fold protein [Pseudohongiella sp.]|nr:alpha/beta hydrolase-fold protein [Pseudohongiella sp.]